MAFSIIKAETRLARMIVWFGGIQQRITDFIVGGKTRTKFEAIAVEMEAQDLAFYRAVKRAIAVSVYQSFDFTLELAVRATGNVTFSSAVPAAADVLISKGTQVATVSSSTSPEKVYETTQAATLLAGQSSVAVPVACTVPGTAGNTGLGTVTVIKTTVSGIDAVTNPSAFTNGAARETEEARRIRFREYISTLAQGTDAAIEYRAKTAKLVDGDGNITEQVTQAKVVDAPALTAGFSDCFVFNGVGATSNDLVTETQKIVDGYVDASGKRVPGPKAAGTVCTVRKATEKTQAVTAVLSLLPGFDSAAVIAIAEAAIDAYLSGLKIGEGVVRHELVGRIMAVAGVYDVALSLPAANVAAQEVVAAAFTGTGLDDATSGGTYTGEGLSSFVVEIDGTGTPDTFRWSKDGGATWEASAVAITGAAQALALGVTVAFGATTGHTVGDAWTFTGTGAVVFLPGALDVTVE